MHLVIRETLPFLVLQLIHQLLVLFSVCTPLEVGSVGGGGRCEEEEVYGGVKGGGGVTEVHTCMIMIGYMIVYVSLCIKTTHDNVSKNPPKTHPPKNPPTPTKPPTKTTPTQFTHLPVFNPIRCKVMNNVCPFRCQRRIQKCGNRHKQRATWLFHFLPILYYYMMTLCAR